MMTVAKLDARFLCFRDTAETSTYTRFLFREGSTPVPERSKPPSSLATNVLVAPTRARALSLFSLPLETAITNHHTPFRRGL